MSKSGLWVTTGAEGSAGCEAISAYVSSCFSVVMGRPRVGGWGLEDLDFEDLAWSRTFACYVSCILMSGANEMVVRIRTYMSSLEPRFSLEERYLGLTTEGNYDSRKCMDKSPP
jgi:hypothetical protein